ncbi:glutathione S-transferase family protein [Pelagibius litoralis]|uniref:Glutathione S-transferase family protein n=1 Tax=Pelagibius litoralis TaxID=374515 RepID=A0A967EWZ7_9PROT|nr:glutathione S-transferase family protein [Pelagibius litoralis]NIA69123.1 glutathione S-transferase family protein [Pelagibius litoralis]
MPDELVFYTNPRSRGRIVRWMLEEVGTPYRTEIVDYGPAMKGPDYLAINPMGKVPAVRHGDTVITECAAICAYLADAFPEAGLAPPPGRRGSYYRWLFFAAGPVESAVLNHALGFDPEDDKQAMVGYGNFGTVMDTLEKALAGGGYIAGESFTAADLYLGSQVNWGLQFGTMEERPGFADYVARLTARDAFRRANDLDNAAVATE